MSRDVMDAIEQHGVRSASSVPEFQTRRPSHEQIGILAYQLWLDRGSPLGSPEQDWFAAERTLTLGS